MQHEQDGPALAPEQHHIDFVPENERHGRPRDLFYVWFAANVSIGNAVFGAVAVFLGNSLFWAVMAVLLGNLLGAAFMAYHSAQGPTLGVPQLIQSRGQFGYYGALLPIALAALLYSGFFVLSAVIAGQAFTAVFDGMSSDVGIALGALVSLALALVGYRLIHRVAKIATWPLAACVVVLTVATLGEGGLDWQSSGFQTGPFFLAVALLATFQLTYAPYVSDYSRYLPKDTSVSATFWATYLGVTTSVIWAEILGVFLAVQFADLGTLDAAYEVLGGGGLAVVVLLLTAVAIGGNNALNLYGGQLNLITAISSFRRVPTGARVRVAFIVPMFVAGTLAAMAASDDFIANVTNFLTVLQLTFVPWGAINLTDFYLVRRGRYDVGAFFEPRGAYYEDRATWTFHGIAWKAMLCYALGIAIQLPFVSNQWITGFLVDDLGGGDFSFLVGFVVPAVAYLLLMRRSVPAAPSGREERLAEEPRIVAEPEPVARV